MFFLSPEGLFTSEASSRHQTLNFFVCNSKQKTRLAVLRSRFRTCMCRWVSFYILHVSHSTYSEGLQSIYKYRIPYKICWFETTSLTNKAGLLFIINIFNYPYIYCTIFTYFIQPIRTIFFRQI